METGQAPICKIYVLRSYDQKAKHTGGGHPILKLARHRLNVYLYDAKIRKLFWFYVGEECV